MILDVDPDAVRRSLGVQGDFGVPLVRSWRHPRGDSHVSESSIDEIAHANPGPVQHGCGRAGCPDIACLDRHDSQRRGMNQIS